MTEELHRHKCFGPQNIDHVFNHPCQLMLKMTVFCSFQATSKLNGYSVTQSKLIKERKKTKNTVCLDEFISQFKVI